MARLTDEFLQRTKRYAAGAIRCYVNLPKGREEVSVLGKQMLRSGTSVAAQVRDANRARSTSEFVAKLGGAIQEADETMLWLELLAEECAIQDQIIQDLRQESSELIAIMTSMINRSRE
jgi:four helix bundle protein